MNAMLPKSKLSRRLFLVAGAAAGGGLALGFHLPARAAVRGTEVNAWIVIQPDDTVILRVARSEMGQGTFTAAPMLVAEELECDWAKVRAEFAPLNEHIRRNRIWRSTSTGGSRSIRESQSYLREAGAAAREMLVAAAAARWGVPAGECRAAKGVVVHAPSNRAARYGELAEAAAKLKPPASVKLKDPKDWTIIGKPTRRLDIADKVLGKPVYAMDVSVPGMAIAAIRHCPTFGGTLKSHDAAAVAGMKGVIRVVADKDWVAVVADSYWRAEQALAKMKIEWDRGANAAVSSASIRAFLKAGIESNEAALGTNTGDALAALAKGKVIEAEYEAPFLNHATMEPMTATAHVTADRCEVWAPTQSAEATAAAASSASGLPLEKVEVHRTMLGGGFGRRGAFQDWAREAVLIAKAAGRPVKLIWSREEDMRQGRYRPVSMARHRAVLGADGMPEAWWVRIAGHSILNSVFPDRVRGGLDMHFLSGFDPEEFRYAIPNYRLDYAMRNTSVPVGFWRAVNHTQNAFFRECFIDEMAHAAKQDPYQYRRKLLAGEKGRRDLGVLDAAAKHAGWDKPPAAGTFRGIAVQNSYGSHAAHVVEIAMQGGEVRVLRVVSAIDPGYAVNPATIETQTESCVVYALTMALYGEITIKDGAVEQGNFHDYPMLKIDRMPKVETVIVPSGGFWGGVGEPALPPLAPALANAIFAATGKRIRSLPLTRHGLVKA
jgi:isoquinoline 1-oxidoreductase subunit beta